MHEGIVVGARADDVEGVGGGFVASEEVEGAGEAEGDAGAHDDGIDTCEEGTVDGRKVGHLNFFEVVDGDGVAVAFFGEEDFDEVAGDAEFLHFAGVIFDVEGEADVGLGGGFAAGDIEAVPDAGGHGGEGEVIEGAADVAALVAVLEAADEDLIEGGAGDDAELGLFSNGAGRPPTGNTDAHTALNNDRKPHSLILPRGCKRCQRGEINACVTRVFGGLRGGRRKG